MTNDEIRIAVAEVMGWKWYLIPNAFGDTSPQRRTLFHPDLHEYEGQDKKWLTKAVGDENIANGNYMWRGGARPQLPTIFGCVCGV